MKIKCDDEVVFEVKPHMVDAMAYFEPREMAEKRFGRIILTLMEAHAKVPIARLRNHFKDDIKGDYGDEEFVKKVMELEKYRSFDQRLAEAQKKAEQKKAESIAKNNPVEG